MRFQLETALASAVLLLAGGSSAGDEPWIPEDYRVSSYLVEGGDQAESLSNPGLRKVDDAVQAVIQRRPAGDEVADLVAGHLTQVFPESVEEATVQTLYRHIPYPPYYQCYEGIVIVVDPGSTGLVAVLVELLMPMEGPLGH